MGITHVLSGRKEDDVAGGPHASFFPGLLRFTVGGEGAAPRTFVSGELGIGGGAVTPKVG